MKVMTILGTRPEIIRLSCIIKHLDDLFDHVLVHTGQNHDYELSEVFFGQLGIREPNHFLNVDKSTLGATLGDVLKHSERVISHEKPEAVLILGDTNSCIAGFMAKRMRIPVYHMEAGNRCFDENVPEEINRRMIDHVSDFNLPYTEHARRNLLAEGLHPRRVVVTGSPMREVLNSSKSAVESSTVLTRLGLLEGKFFLVSAHREENVDNPLRLRAFCDSLDALADKFGLPIVVSTHPRTRNRLQAQGLEIAESVVFMEPFGFYDYVRLQMAAKCVLSDSGTVSEEAYMLRFPAVTFRSSIERPEALEAGTIILSDMNPDRICEAVTQAIDNGVSDSRIADYDVPNTSEIVANLIRSTAPVHAEWSGLR
jgi:UDP-N-acetylglucosamine 2-epimerase